TLLESAFDKKAFSSKRVVGRGKQRLSVHVYGCASTIFYMEHVQLQVTAESTKRGNIDIDLISPL
ncbi:hypothetical protein Ciccas_012373, partial [Cichlidogyrus casuarinus]